MNDLKKLNKKQLINLVISLNASLKKSRNANDQKLGMVRHFRRRLYKIRDSIDYLLKHPFSEDRSNRTLKHKRDTGNF